MKKYFKTQEKIKRKSISRTKKEQAVAREAGARFLNSPEGKAALERVSSVDKLSQVLATKFIKSDVVEF